MKSLLLVILAAQVLSQPNFWQNNGNFPRPGFNRYRNNRPWGFPPSFQIPPRPVFIPPRPIIMPPRPIYYPHHHNNYYRNHHRNYNYSPPAIQNTFVVPNSDCGCDNRNYSFTKTFQPLPIYWKNRKSAVTASGSTSGSSIRLRYYRNTNDSQKWIFSPADATNSSFFITSYNSKLAITSNGDQSPLTLEDQTSSQNQKFCVNQLSDGSYQIYSAYRNLYWEGSRRNRRESSINLRSYDASRDQIWNI